MFVALVTGSVVATQKTESMTGHKLLVVEPYRLDEKARDRLVSTGRTFIAVDTLDDKLKIAKQLGATHTVNATDPNALEQIRDISGGGVEYGFEMASSAKALDLAVPLVLGFHLTRTVLCNFLVGPVYRAAKAMRLLA